MEEVDITHFVNPHLFWFKFKSFKSKKESIQQLERKLKNFTLNCRKTLTHYKCGDFVALYFIPRDKYVRATVVEVWPNNKSYHKYIVWLLDHGFPVFTDEKHLIPLPKVFHYHIGIVHRGGISNILPIEKDYYSMNQHVNNWTERSYREMNGLVSESSTIHLLVKNKTDKHVWCDLRIENKDGEICMASNFLEKHNLGEIVQSKIFEQLCVDLVTLKQVAWEKINKSANYVKNEIEKVVIPKASMCSEDFSISQASQNKVKEWLQNNFEPGVSVLSSGQKQTGNKGDNVAAELILEPLHNYVQYMQQLIPPPTWYSQRNVINKFLSEMPPPVPNIRAFDMSNMKKIQNKIIPPFATDKSTQQDSVSVTLSGSNISLPDIKAIEISNIDKEEEAVLIKNKEKLEKIPIFSTDKTVQQAYVSLAQILDNAFSENMNNKPQTKLLSPFDDNDLQCENPPLSSSMAKKKKGIFLPAGYDVTQLSTYRNPNHWHRAKTTSGIKLPLSKDLKHNDYLKQNRIPSQQNKDLENASVQIHKQQKMHWSQLSLKLTKIKLHNNIDWSNFYVQLANPESIKKYNDLNEYFLMKSDQLIPVENESKLVLGANYVVKYIDLFYRSILQNTHNNTKGLVVYSFFFVDNAFVYEVESNENICNNVYHTSTQIINLMPFQTVNCSLVGVDQNSCKHINFTLDEHSSLYAFPCVIDKKAIKNLDINSYKIALFECDEGKLNENGLPNSGLFLNAAFLKSKLIKCDKDSLFYFEADFGLQEKPLTRSLAQRFVYSN